MEENNKLDNNANGSLYSSALYGADAQPQTGEKEHSSVYGQAEESKAVQETEQERSTETKLTSDMTQVSEIPKMTEMSETTQVSEKTKVTGVSEMTQASENDTDSSDVKVPVSLEKPAQTMQSGQSYQSNAVQPPAGNANPQGFYGQFVNPNQMNGNPTGYNGQPVNLNYMSGNLTGYNGQPMNPNYMSGNPTGYNGQPMNGNQMNGNPTGYNGQPMNGNQMNGNPTGYNGQPMNSNYMNGNPTGYNGQPIYNGQPVNAQPKKSRTGLIAGIAIAAAVLVVAAAGVIFSRTVMNSPKKQLAKGMANMAKEMEAYTSSVSDDIGVGELRKLRKSQPMHTNIDLSFTDPSASGSFNNVSVELDTISDAKNKRGKYDVSVGTYGFDMEIANIVADSNTLYISSQLLFRDDVYSLGLTNLGRDFNNSAWADLFESTLPDDYSLTLFAEGSDSADTDAQSTLELGRIFQSYAKNNAGSIEYAAIREKREFPYGGNLTEYGGVQVTLDKDTYNEMMEKLTDDILSSAYYADYLERYKMTYGSDFDAFKNEFDHAIEQVMGLRFGQDIVLNFYLDRKGRIINISTPEDLAVVSPYSELDSIAVDIDFGGDERTLDSIAGGIYMQSGDEILYLGVSRTAYITDDFYSEDLTISLQSDSSSDDITFYYGNDWGYSDKTYDMTISLEAAGETISLTADGGYEDIVKGEGYTFRVSNAALSMDDEDLLLMSGVISMEPAKDSKIEVPENAVDILKMSYEDISSALYKAIYSMQ